MPQSLKILIVDDSLSWKNFIVTVLSDYTEFEIVGTASNGKEAINILKHTPVDVVLLDIEMPVMDGLTALPQIMKINPMIFVIMISLFTKPHAKMTLQALSRGAADFIPKPGLSNLVFEDKNFVEELTEKLQFFYSHKIKKVSKQYKLKESRHLKKISSEIRLIAIGASTGGPKALLELLPLLCKKVNIPILIVQHMPVGFTQAFAELLGKKLDRPCKEAVSGDPIKPKHIYIAPGGFHMTVLEDKFNNNYIIKLNQNPPVNFARPSVDVLYDSIAKLYKHHSLAIVLSGMGEDGKNGAKNLMDAGAKIFVQDESTSVVWGMPGSIADAGFAYAILPIKKLAFAVQNEIIKCNKI